jgi:multiple sugar transport system ATP-binding protein
VAEIVLEEVSKTYDGGTLAVDDVSLSVPDGALAVLVGPSGCGKTTLLRMVAGLEEISGGSISIGGRTVNDVPAKNRDIAMVFQNYALYPHMTIYGNIAFGLKLRHVDKQEIQRRVNEAAHILGLDDVLDRRPAQLSGGQRQRVAMGRAIVREPKAFLMDEPLSNLDAKLRVQMRAEISRIQRQFRTTTVYVTHDQIEAMTMGDVVAVMRGGVLQQVASPQELYEKPANSFVAGFIGSPAMNMVEADIAAVNGGLEIRFGNRALTLAPGQVERRPKLRSYDGRRVVLGIRPEAMDEPGRARFSSSGNRLQVVPELCESVGHEVYVHFSVDQNDRGADVVESGTRFVARVDPATSAREGVPVELSVDTDALHFFDQESGAAIVA